MSNNKITKNQRDFLVEIGGLPIWQVSELSKNQADEKIKEIEKLRGKINKKAQKYNKRKTWQKKKSGLYNSEKYLRSG